jgi:hypothetical protein
VGWPGSDVGPSTGSSRAFFDNIDHDLLMKAVTKQAKDTNCTAANASHSLYLKSG